MPMPPATTASKPPKPAPVTPTETAAAPEMQVPTTPTTLVLMTPTPAKMGVRFHLYSLFISVNVVLQLCFLGSEGRFLSFTIDNR